MSATESLTYEAACEAHRWQVPERYNIAADVCDRQPGEKTAMIFEDFRGNQRKVSWAEQRSLANRAANLLVAHGVERGDRVAVCAPASPETAAMFLGAWKTGADPALALRPLRERGHRAPHQGLPAAGDRHRRRERRAHAGVAGRRGDRADPRAPRRSGRGLRNGRHLGRRSGPDLLHVGHHRPRQGHPPRPPLHPRPRGVRLLPRGAGGRALPRDGGVGLGGRHLPPDRAVALRRRSVRLRAGGRLRSARAAPGPVGTQA